MSSETQQRRQRPLSFLLENDEKVCLIILNRPLKHCKDLLRILWAKASLKVCADGGANRLYDLFHSSEEEKFIPDLISGDFDSAREDVLEFYSSRGATVVETPDQNETDFTKAIRETGKLHTGNGFLPKDYSCIVVLAAFGGRFDHCMANVDTLFKVAKINNKPCYLVSESSLTCLLQPGQHLLELDTEYEGDWCALVPIGSPARNVTTTGLKWNLANDELRFGSLISTSNTFVGNTEVTIETTDPLLWIMEVNLDRIHNIKDGKNVTLKMEL